MKFEDEKIIILRQLFIKYNIVSWIDMDEIYIFFELNYKKITNIKVFRKVADKYVSEFQKQTDFIL